MGSPITNYGGFSRILVLRFEALGDMILSTPLLRELREAFPRAEIILIASPAGKDAIENNPCVDRIVIMDHLRPHLAQVLRIILELKSRRIDLSINLTEKIWGYLIPRLASIKTRVGFYPGLSQPIKALLVWMLANRRVLYRNDPRRRSGEHEVQRQQRILRDLGLPGINRGLELHLQPEDLSTAGEYLRAFEGRETLALHLSWKWFREGLDVDFLARICEELIKDRPQSSLLVTYMESEKAKALEILRRMPQSRAMGFCHARFQLWAAALGKCRCVITMDTSATHVASALGVPAVVIFPQPYFEHASERWKPWFVPHRILRAPMRNMKGLEGREQEFRKEIIRAVEELLD